MPNAFGFSAHSRTQIPNVLGISPTPAAARIFGALASCARYAGDGRSCPWTWCRSGCPEQRWLLDQAAAAGRVTMGSSLSGAMVSRLM